MSLRRLSALSAIDPRIFALAPSRPGVRPASGLTPRDSEFVWLLHDGHPLQALVELDTAAVRWLDVPRRWDACLCESTRKPCDRCLDLAGLVSSKTIRPKFKAHTEEVPA